MDITLQDMGALQIIAAIIASPVISLATLFVLALPGFIVNDVAKRLGLKKEKNSRQLPGWGYLSTFATPGSFAWTMYSLLNAARLRHMTDKVSGDNTTRLELTLREDTPEAREALGFVLKVPALDHTALKIESSASPIRMLIDTA